MAFLTRSDIWRGSLLPECCCEAFDDRKIRDPRSLHIVKEALDDIETAMKREREYRAEYDGSSAQNLDACHISEKISIELTVRFYKRLGEQAEFNAMQEKELFDRGFALLETLTENYVAISGQNYLIQYVQQQLCVSLSQLALLDRYAVSEMEIFPIVLQIWSAADDYPARLESLWQGALTLVVSSLVTLVWEILALELRKVSLAECESVKTISQNLLVRIITLQELIWSDSTSYIKLPYVI